MKTITVKARLQALSLGLFLSGAFSPAVLQAELAAETMADFTSSPIVSAESATPMVMVAASNDHQLFFKAYNDYTDLDKDGTLETTYKHSFDYYGYFDKNKCYSHSGGLFVPQAVTTDKYCDAVSGDWSGNFLNWATMARIDAVRKILFGGLRSVDTSSNTVLERTYLPNDAHSFAKYYNGADIARLTPFNPPTADADAEKNGLTICNTTVASDSALRSEDVPDAPLLRVATGNYSLWASNERWQCRWSEEKSASNANDAAASGIDAYSGNPTKSTKALGSGDYVVKVKVCVSGLLESNCKQYPDGNYKPIGLLQRYGDDDKVLFGMFAGSYTKNKSGGTLIRDIGSMSDEVDVTGDGHFLKAFTSGEAWNTAEGIINAWSLYRPVGYKHSDGTYGTSGLNANNCTWGINYFTDGQCMNWGNPFSEIYHNAIRYLAGESPSGQFRANDSSTIKALNTPQVWNCPLDDTNYCASLNVINFNASTISYDNDQLDGSGYGVGEIWSGANSVDLTKVVGDGENITGNQYFVGENGTDNNELCTAKTVTNLGNVEGLCTEAPRLEGTYRVAGIAHKAHTSDIRSTGPAELEGDQLVDTYSVTLAPAVPEITIPVPGNTSVVRILPACQNSTVGGNCALVDFKVVQPHTEAAGVGTGKFYVNWEDSEQGGDYDQDMWGVISYTVTSTEVTITTDSIAKSTPYEMGFGYVVSGTTQDGFHVHSGINSYDHTDADATIAGCSDCEHTDGATSQVYTVGGSAAGLLNDPLYYASKWGAFIDENGNAIPDLNTEWDRKDGQGNRTPDGLPDTYYYATDPEELERSLGNVLNAIIAKTASGTAASVVASSREGQGAVFQAMYVTERSYDNKTVNWVGNLHSLWIDNVGLIREDSNSNRQLDDYQTDKVVQVFFDNASRQTRVCRFESNAADVYDPVILNAALQCQGTSLPLEELKPIWNARERLSAVTNVTTQRSYNTSAANGRHIMTWVDADLDGVVDAGEYVDFTPTGIDTGNKYGYLNAVDTSSADDIVNYIRGEEISGMRNRTMDFDGDGTDEVLRLGDIVHSTPTAVSVPAEAFDQLYGDVTYSTFRAQYAQRRQVIYLGANDGLLHAFNAGFFNPFTKTFELSPNGETPHPVGSELWAYAPGNLLPHLKWLTDPDYSHVYYMDAKPRVFDAKIFTDDADHPGGWGTVLVAGMRFGGGTMTVDTADDGLGGNNTDGDASDDHSFRSAYVILDVTNPETAPKLIAELSHPNLGLTTSYPTAMAVRENDDSVNKWYLVFGTGPTNLASATSSQDGRLLAYDLSANQWVTEFSPTSTNNVIGANTFLGDPIAADWDLDYKANELYVGSVGGTAASPTGDLYRLEVKESATTSSWVLAKRLATGKPIVARPTLSVDKNLSRWVFTGTGRFFVNDDKTSTAQQTLFGFRDNPPASATTTLPLTSNLVDVTGVQVSTVSPFTVTGVTGVTDFGELEALFNATGSNWKDGWELDLPILAGEPAARMVQEGALLGRVLLMTDFTPSVNLCGGDGHSNLYGLYFKTGTPLAETPIFGETATNVSIRELDLGEGMASAPSLHLTRNPPWEDGNKESVVVQKSRGDILTGEARLPAPVKSGETSWREHTE